MRRFAVGAQESGGAQDSEDAQDSPAAAVARALDARACARLADLLGSGETDESPAAASPACGEAPKSAAIRTLRFPILLLGGCALLQVAPVVPGAVPMRRSSPSASHQWFAERRTERSSEMRFERMSMSGARALAMAVAAGGSIAGVAAGDAVEWRVEDGGNGHWYAARAVPLSDAAIALAESLGGHLATIASEAENAMVASVFLPTGKQWGWIGLRQRSRQASPAYGWYWMTGEPLVYQNWTTHPFGPAPDDSPCGLAPLYLENDQANQGAMERGMRWDDLEIGQHSCGNAWDNVAIIEWSADCNANGVVDFGEIRNGLATDANGDHIPDECQCATHPGLCCDGDVIESGTVDGVDLAAILATWGTDGGKYPRADVDGSGVVDGADLAIVLGDWGPCE